MLFVQKLFLYYYTVAFRCNSCSTRKVSMPCVCVFCLQCVHAVSLKLEQFVVVIECGVFFSFGIVPFFDSFFFLLFALVHSFSTCTPLLFLSFDLFWSDSFWLWFVPLCIQSNVLYKRGIDEKQRTHRSRIENSSQNEDGWKWFRYVCVRMYFWIGLNSQ